jgi:asparagine synthase (glutamine-hydrolysing)
MNDALAHRGPNDQKLFTHDHVGLAFRRLSIMDLTSGQQPMANEHKTVWMVFNGEIYNSKELRGLLKGHGHDFASEMDGEVILHLYEEKGIRLLDDLRGMFAFTLYDTRSQELFLARDHFGIKPLYYADEPHQFLFASEIKSLLAGRRVRPTVQTESLWRYLSFQYVPDPDTMFDGIHVLPPAHYLRFSDCGFSLHRYWQPRYQPDETKPLSYFTENIAEVLENSVKQHKQSDVPYGAFLSAGIDSSIIASLLQREETIDTFTVSYAGANPHLDESVLARETAQLLKTRHHSMEITTQHVLDELQNIVYHQDQPLADPSIIGVYFLAQLARKHVTVALSGEGADELFGGYPIYHEPKSLWVFDMLPTGLRNQLGNMARKLPYGMKGRSFLERGALPLQRRFIGNAYIFNDDVKQTLVHDAIRSRQPASIFDVTDPFYEEIQDLDPITQMQLLDMNTWLPGDILMKADKMTMAHSLELRVPFLDRKVFDLAATIPAKFRIAHGTTKYALRQSVAHLLPEVVQNRPKMGFPTPYRQWIKGDLREWIQDTLHSAHMNFFFNRSFIDQLMSEYLSGQRDNARQIWTLFMFGLWHETYIQNAKHFVPAVVPEFQNVSL